MSAAKSRNVVPQNLEIALVNRFSMNSETLEIKHRLSQNMSDKKTVCTGRAIPQSTICITQEAIDKNVSRGQFAMENVS
jgi:hypothetical protein